MAGRRRSVEPSPGGSGSKTPRNGDTGQFESKFTPEIRAKFLKALGVGAPTKTACAYAGISHVTLGAWLRRSYDDDAPEEYVKFREDVDAAFATWVVASLEQLERLGIRGNSSAITWALERRLPQEFGTKARIEHSGRVLHGHVDLTRLTDDQLEALDALLELATPDEDDNVVDFPRAM